MRAVLDVNVLISALLSRTGASGRIVTKWLGGAFELVVSEALLVELDRALHYPKLLKRIPADDGAAFVKLLRSTAVRATDITSPTAISRDPGDDYLVALAKASKSVLVTGDEDLLAAKADLPIESPAAFLERLEGLAG